MVPFLRISQPASQRRHPGDYLPRLRISSVHYHTWHFVWVLGIELRSLCFQDKYCIDGTVILVSKVCQNSNRLHTYNTGECVTDFMAQLSRVECVVQAIFRTLSIIQIWYFYCTALPPLLLSKPLVAIFLLPVIYEFDSTSWLPMFVFG